MPTSEKCSGMALLVSGSTWKTYTEPLPVSTDAAYNPTMSRTSETLVGSIERVTFHNLDNGFAV